MNSFLAQRDKIQLEFSSDTGLKPVGVVIGRGHNALEVAIAEAGREPTADQMRRAWRDRRRGRPNPVLLVVLYNDKAALCGPAGESPPLHSDLSVSQVERICNAALDEADRHAAHRLLGSVLGGLEEEFVGIRNEGLLAGYYLKSRLPNSEYWAEARKKSEPLLKIHGDDRGKKVVEGLGFELQELTGQAYVLVAKETRVAVAVFLEPQEAFDYAQERFSQRSPISYALLHAERNRLPYVVATCGGRIRLHLVDPSAGVAPRGPTETFVEIHLDLLDDKDAGYLWLLLSADALKDGGTLEDILAGSRDYSADLGKRLRERIYERVLPALSRGIASAIGLEKPGQKDLDEAYGIALTFLFRLLFIGYAEDKGLLPYQINEWYMNRSLKRRARELLSTYREGREFDASSTSHWDDVFVLFHAIHRGNREWGVPEYDGDLFSSDPKVFPIGARLEAFKLGNDVSGPVLRDLLLDWTQEEVVGPVDFGSLGVREFGVIYEGLLDSELSLADEALTVGANGLYVPAGTEDVVVRAGEVYLHNASGQRKSTGTFYTKYFVVEHLLDRALEPALDEHLGRIDGLGDRDAEEAFFDFRVADIAMGSGHFLVAAVDHIERRFSAYLLERHLPGVLDELNRLRETATKAIGEEHLLGHLDDRSLLRRQIARRCIYGVDLNPLAVQLSRLSVWTHTFVPGLPLSFLNHNLVLGNSIVGVGTPQEAADVLGLKGDTLLLWQASDKIEAMEKALDALGKLADADAKEIREARKAQVRLEKASAPLQAVLDMVTASRVEPSIDVKSALADAASLEMMNGSDSHKRALETLESLHPFHFPTAFPEVLRRENPGFDVIVGNPPWQEATLEEDDFWTRYVPGLQGLPQVDQERIKAEWRSERPDLVEKLNKEVDRQSLVRSFLVNGPFPGMGTGDPDVYKAFCWRFWDLVRQGGHVGVVLPRSAFAAKGSETFRRHLLRHATFDDLTMLLNNRQWVFPEIHPQYTIALPSFRKLPPNKSSRLPLFGPFRSLPDFRQGVRKEPLRLAQADVLKWTESAMLPLLSTPKSGSIFLKMREAPDLGDPGRSDWRLRPVRELDATNEKKAKDGTTLMHFVEEPPEGYWPIYKGASFNQWVPDTGTYYAWADPDVMMKYLQAKRERAARNSRSPFHEMDSDWIQDEKTLPCFHPRVAFRDIARATDTRTVIVSLLPPQVFITNRGPYFVWPRGDEKDQAYLLGVLNSIPLNWYARRFVEIIINFHILNSFPVPAPSRENPLWVRTVELAGRLAASDDRYSSWARSVGTEWGPLSEDDKRELVYELDAVVTHLYGLEEADLVHVYETFHEGWDYAERMKSTLEYYHQWEGKT